MKKVLGYLLLVLIVAVLFVAWSVLAGATSFPEKSKTVVINENETSINAIADKLVANKIIKNKWAFIIADYFSATNKTIVAGKYEIVKGQTARRIINMMKAGKFAEVRLVINKIRIREDFAKLISKSFPLDSSFVMQFISSNDSLSKFGVDTNTFHSIIIPNTYTFYWNASLVKILTKLKDEAEIFWSKENRLQKASEIGLTPEQIYTLSSIVEEESNYNDDRPNVASVYINRLNKGMPLQADPTIKFAMKDFTLKRIYEKYLFIPSAYNTYRNKGLPPGPICTPSIKCIDIVLNAPKTDYLYFVANANFDGRHHFSSNYTEHLQYAKQYQKALDEYLQKKEN